MSAACQYETDVTDAQWELLYPLLPQPTWTPGSRGQNPRARGKGTVHRRRRQQQVMRGWTATSLAAALSMRSLVLCVVYETREAKSARKGLTKVAT